MAIFLYFIYKEKWPKMCLKMAIKWPKTLQMSWNSDQTCISMSFIKFQKIFGKFAKLADFWPKNGHLTRFPRREIIPFFSTENVSGPSKMLRMGWKSVYLFYIMPSTELWRGFLIFWVLAVLWGSKGTKGAFFGQKTLNFSYFEAFLVIL